jgi:hypothetical protein
MAKSVSELLNGPDAELVKRYTDSRVSQAVKTFAEKHPSDSELAERLQRLESGMDAKLSAVQLQNYTLRQCVKLGIQYEDIESLGMAFRDEGDVNTKLAALAKRIRAKETADLNLLYASGSKPGSGNPASEKTLFEKRIEGMSASDRAILESSGELDRLMRD